MFSCDKLNRTKLEIICVSDCIGQKFNIVSDTASFIKQSNVSGYFINFSFFVRCINYRLTMRGNLIFPVPSNLWWKIMQWRIGRRKLLTKSWKNVSKVRRFTRNFGLGSFINGGFLLNVSENLRRTRLCEPPHLTSPHQSYYSSLFLIQFSRHFTKTKICNR